MHQHAVQESFRRSLIHILSDASPTSMDICRKEVLEDSILLPKTKEQLMEYLNDGCVHSVVNVTFGEVFQYVWTRIQNHKDHANIKAILNEEMNDAMCMCFTGRLTRLINALNGFCDDVAIKIADNQQIGNMIHIFINKLKEKNEYSDDKLKELVEKELKERGYETAVIEDWLNAI